MSDLEKARRRALVTGDLGPYIREARRRGAPVVLECDTPQGSRLTLTFGDLRSAEEGWRPVEGASSTAPPSIAFNMRDVTRDPPALIVTNEGEGEG